MTPQISVYCPLRVIAINSLEQSTQFIEYSFIEYTNPSEQSIDPSEQYTNPSEQSVNPSELQSTGSYAYHQPFRAEYWPYWASSLLAGSVDCSEWSIDRSEGPIDYSEWSVDCFDVSIDCSDGVIDYYDSQSGQ